MRPYPGKEDMKTQGCYLKGTKNYFYYNNFQSKNNHLKQCTSSLTSIKFTIKIKNHQYSGGRRQISLSLMPVWSSE